MMAWPAPAGDSRRRCRTKAVDVTNTGRTALISLHIPLRPLPQVLPYSFQAMIVTDLLGRAREADSEPGFHGPAADLVKPGAHRPGQPAPVTFARTVHKDSS